jgi:hypothetical protein
MNDRHFPPPTPDQRSCRSQMIVLPTVLLGGTHFGMQPSARRGSDGNLTPDAPCATNYRARPRGGIISEISVPSTDKRARAKMVRSGLNGVVRLERESCTDAARQATKKGRCRLHGGASGSGGPPGERNGQYRHGERTKGAIAERQKFSVLLRMLRAGLM